MEEIVTTDLTKFGFRELEMMEELSKAWRTQGLPVDFWDEGVHIAFNTHSGYVFLTNSDFQAAMMNGDNLESHYFCPYCGHEGFKEDMEHDPEADDCTEYLEQIGVIEED